VAAPFDFLPEIAVLRAERPVPCAPREARHTPADKIKNAGRIADT
jgi:hypothetical protein